MKVIIAGSRTIEDPTIVEEVIRNSGFTITEVVCGGAAGVDEIGDSFAIENNLSTKYFLPDWDKYGRATGPIRNKEMAKYADALIAIWNGTSSGTKNMIEEMQKLGKLVYVEIVK